MIPARTPGPQLRRCTVQEVPRLAAIRRAREDWMLTRGIEQWRPGSLDQSAILAQVERGEWFRLLESGEAADGAVEPMHAAGRWHPPARLQSPARLHAAARLLDTDPEFWDEDVESALYVHGLMVDLAAAGHGLGTRVLELAAAEGRRRQRAVLRLDCAPHLLEYYRRRGFAPVRHKRFPDFTTVLLERPLT